MPFARGKSHAAFALQLMPGVIRLIMVRSFLILYLFAFSNAFACSCGEGTEDDAYENSDVVFLARVLATKLVTDSEDSLYPEYVRGQIEVIETFKGDTTNVRYVVSGTTNNTCSILIAAGEKYIIYGASAETIRITACGFSRWFNLVKESAWLKKRRQ
ncbi:MAG: hypothetical protein D6816_00415 [Bacteroidetes bacterium]|nr:MAG: hypothetical protein D6816_00415 [Bacteroidota bacterium]